ESCRLLILVGISGIGKTALAEKLAVELHQEFLQGDWSKFRQENCDNQQETRDFRSVASRWLKKWGESLTQDDYQDVERLLYKLVNRLRQHRYLIIIDSLENILVGNEDEGWSDFQDEWWVRFFEQFLAAPECQSRIILTSQDFPGQIPGRYQNFWESKPLTGLRESEQLQLFGKTGLEVEDNSPNLPYLQRIGKAYEGHPLALRVIAGEIGSKPFNGNVVAYWKRYGNEIEEVEKGIEEAKSRGITGADDRFQLDRYTRLLRKKVKSRLDKTFFRLRKDAFNAYRLICATGIYRCEVPESFWLSHLEDWSCSKDEQEVALLTLRDRCLVEVRVDESGEFLLRQHNLIRSVSLENLKKLDGENG
ncbi:MAG: AAA family ATPase, partial [Okeania sp. SIO3B3]|nr:AAA family ATPase [Okeania sp. SIO3B3]